MNDILLPALSIIILIFSAILHEVAHGAMAYRLGDPTAKYAGRLTLNPIKHLDPIGSILVPLVLIIFSPIVVGWAKPVPVNPYNLRDQKYGEAKVAFAGPAINLLLALIFALPLRFFPEIILNYPSLFIVSVFIVFINILLAFFNLVPIPPLDGSHILFAFFPNLEGPLKLFFAKYGIFVFFLFLFFLLPYFFELVNFVFELMVGFSF